MKVCLLRLLIVPSLCMATTLGAQQQPAAVAESLAVAQDSAPPQSVPPSQAASAPAPAPATAPAPAVVAGDERFALRLPAGILYGVFTKEDGPFLIEGSVVVPSGERLEFGPGCEVYVGGKYSTITVFGEMVVKGSAQAPVSFQSANNEPNPWDWDRIYVRSRNRSVFEHMVLRHCNYGLFVENGQVAVTNCLFERNSLHGLVVKNSAVTVRNSTFRGGHVLALFCQSGAQVSAESLMVSDNITGVACAAQATLQVSGGAITRNTNGISLMQNSSVSIVDADISRNRIGVISSSEIPKRMAEMVYHNSVDIRSATDTQIEELFKVPEEVKSIVLPRSKTEIALAQDFKAGFSALKRPAEPTTSFIGNVTAGLKVYLPESDNGYRLDSTDTNNIVSQRIYQSRYPGEQSEEWYAGVQPETQIFMSGRKGRADVNLLADFYGNQWTGFQRNMLNLVFALPQQRFVFGDFYENGSEISISGRKMTGLKVEGSLLEMGRGTKRIAFSLSAGESEMPKDSGDKEIDIYNETVDSAMSVRQQISYVAALAIKPTLNSTINIKGIIARDQTLVPMLRNPVSDPARPKPIQAQSGSIGAEISLLQGNLNLAAEIDLGNHDTLQFDTVITGDGDTVENDPDVAWYRPEVPQSIQRVLGDITEPSSFAGTFNASMSLSGYDLGLNFTEVRPSYFAAGNPFLETDRRKFELTSEKQFQENFAATAAYTFEQSYVSNTLKLGLQDGADGALSSNGLVLSAKYSLGEELPEFSADWDCALRSQAQSEEKTDTTILSADSAMVSTNAVEFGSRELRNVAGVEVKQRFANGMDYSVRYRALLVSDVGDRSTIDDQVTADENQHQLSLRYSFKMANWLRNKTDVRLALKNKTDGDFRGYSYKISDDARFTIIPRVLSLKIGGDYSFRKDTDTDATLLLTTSTITKSYAAEAEAKWSITSKISFNAMGRYENSYDETPESAENYRVKIGGASVTYLF